MIQPLRHNLSLQLLKVILYIMGTILALIIWASVTGAQTPNTRYANQTTAQGADEPIYSNYMGVSIGMTADEVRAKLKEPVAASAAQFFYVISSKETVQIAFDENKKVEAISIDYIGEGSGAPECRAVIGTQVQPQADGSVYKLVRYPKFGYWVSYNRTSGASSIVTITIQRIQKTGASK